jgi:hypothetical protein
MLPQALPPRLRAANPAAIVCHTGRSSLTPPTFFPPFAREFRPIVGGYWPTAGGWPPNFIGSLPLRPCFKTSKIRTPGALSCLSLLRNVLVRSVI